MASRLKYILYHTRRIQECLKTSPCKTLLRCEINNRLLKNHARPCIHCCQLTRLLSTEAKPKGSQNEAEQREFQAETKMLLEIVAKSLYSDKEIFIRELISNASDSLEKLRYMNQTGEIEDIGHLEIRISSNKQDRILIIEDNGIGMTRDEMITNLGTIAKSGSKAFLEEIKKKGGVQMSSVIGQFGVGFYSAFMVADKIEVHAKSYKPNSVGCKWTSKGEANYEIENLEHCDRGMKIIIHLKTEFREFADDTRIKGVIKKFSNFVNAPVFVNAEQVNTIQPLWIMDPKSLTPQMHDEFYRFTCNSYDRPRFILHFQVDVPLSIKSLLYFPEGKPGLYQLNMESHAGVALYSKRILIQNPAETILPKWLRFVQGVVDSEDIPLNLSRELLQNSALVSKLKTVLTNKIIRFLYEKSAKQEKEYDAFYADYNVFFKEGILSSTNQFEKEEIAKLLRFESSKFPAGTKVSLPQYCERLQEEQKKIFYLAAPSRALAENSPYLEAMKEKNVEVLFCYEPPDELVLMCLRNFCDRPLASVESEMRQNNANSDSNITLGKESLTQEEAKDLISWLEEKLKKQIYTVRLTEKLSAHPCAITVEEMAAARQFIKTQAHLLKDDMKFSLLKPTLEINPRHPLIRKLSKLTTSHPELAVLVAQQLHSNALVIAGLVEDPRTMLAHMNQLLEVALEKY